MLQDSFGRTIKYLRLSVTDRCDLRCVYCMAEHMTFLPKAQILSLEELERIASQFIGLGVTKIRLTGGEPLVRRDAEQLIQKLGAQLHHNSLQELTLTTNGTLLERYASVLYEHGVRRINVSLDCLDKDMFHRLTRGGDLNQVLRGLAQAKKQGLKIKINCVALRTINEHAIPSMMEWCEKEGFDLTLIELMPMAQTGYKREEHYLPLDTLRQTLEQQYELIPLAYRSGGPAHYVEVRGMKMRLGFITPLTGNFCANCNRVRLTATGRLYLCLGQEAHVDLREILRKQGDTAVRNAIIKAMNIKPQGHDFAISSHGVMQGEMKRHMSATGG